MEKNLTGLKVLDFTRVLVGPFLTQVMVDNGAEVIKVERPVVGADERHNAPVLEGVNGKQSGYFMMLNRGKKSLALDMKDPECKEIIYDLIKWADVVTENFAPGVMKKLGYGYDVAKELNPGIIYCSMSVFGQEGPYSHLPGYDIIAQAMSGLMWLTGEADGPPMRVGVPMADTNASGYAWGAIGAALYYRQRTGKGQYIDISLRDLLSSELETGVIRYTQSYGKDDPMRSGIYHATMMPYGAFSCGKGKYCVIVGLNPNHWDGLCMAMDKVEWGKQERFKDQLARGINQKEVIETMETWLSSFDDYMDAIKILQDHRVPAAPILAISELYNDPQWRLRNNLVKVEDPIFGPVELPASAMIFSETSVFNDCPPPLLGQHNTEILKEILGLPDDRIAAINEKCSVK